MFFSLSHDGVAKVQGKVNSLMLTGWTCVSIDFPVAYFACDVVGEQRNVYDGTSVGTVCYGGKRGGVADVPNNEIVRCYEVVDIYARFIGLE